MLPFHFFSAPLCGEPLQIGICPSGARNTEVWGIDTAGTLVGQYDDRNGTHGFLFAQGIFSALNVPEAANTYAHGISANGRQLVGAHSDPARHAHGFRLDAAGYAILDVPGAAHTVAAGVNDAGQIVGFYIDPQAGNMAFCMPGAPSPPWMSPLRLPTIPRGSTTLGRSPVPIKMITSGGMAFCMPAAPLPPWITRAAPIPMLTRLVTADR